MIGWFRPPRFYVCLKSSILLLYYYNLFHWEVMVSISSMYYCVVLEQLPAIYKFAASVLSDCDIIHMCKKMPFLGLPSLLILILMLIVATYCCIFEFKYTLLTLWMLNFLASWAARKCDFLVFIMKIRSLSRTVSTLYLIHVHVQLYVNRCEYTHIYNTYTNLH